MQAVAAHCPGLTSLYAERAGGIDDQAVACLANGCAGLCHLDLGMQEAISDAALLVLAERCRQLRSLSLAYCKVSRPPPLTPGLSPTRLGRPTARRFHLPTPSNATSPPA